MRDSVLSDSPKSEPGEDLLGIAQYAEGLANLIRGAHEPSKPFTIGIYGKWGSGKTTFVNFLEHYLVPDSDTSTPRTAQNSVTFRFVKFSAWPHRTADELWRALILKIAREVYSKREDDAEKAEETAKGVDRAKVSKAPTIQGQADRPPVGPVVDGARVSGAPTILGWIGEFFLPESEERPEVDSKYEDLVARLDETAYGTISKDAQQGARLDQVETTMAIVEAALAGLGALSPLIAWFRSIGGTGLIDQAAQLRREKNKAVRKRVESVREFKQVLKDLFNTKDSHDRLCVFVDDLDRCMPDVALDLMEAIKIILEEFQCVFLLAADVDLISQGLRHRYGAAMKDQEPPGAVDGEGKPSLRPRSTVALRSESPGQNVDYYDRKGREYFEKIVQLRVPIPPLSPEQTSRYITTQFPDWAPAIDIIQLAVDDNPRRIKQHCNWLSYKHCVVTAI